MRAPVFEEELSELYREAKKGALEEFTKTAVGDISKSFLIELKDKMKHKFKLIKQENENVAEVSLQGQQSQDYLITLYKPHILICNTSDDPNKLAAFFMICFWL